MSEASLPVIAAWTAAEAAPGAPLGAAARDLLIDEPTPARFLGALVAGELFVDAIHFLANALPKREAVWWAYLCAREAAGKAPEGPVAAALEAVARWVADPTEPNRRGAQSSGEAVGIGTPSGCAAMAAFWSGGSIGPPELADVPPGEHLTPRGVAGAVLFAVVQTDPERAPEKFRRVLALGREVAAGTNRWERAVRSPPPISASSPATSSQPAPRTVRISGHRS